MPHPVITEIEKYPYNKVGVVTREYPFEKKNDKTDRVEFYNNLQENSFQQVGKAVSLNGGSGGPGPAVIVRDVLGKDCPVNMLHTGGLMGCQAIALTGLNKRTGKVDAYFAHSRDWQNPPPKDNPQHPINLAKEFVAEHDAVRAYAGTNFEAPKGGELGKHFANESRRKLSNTLGIWIREYDLTRQKDATFLPGMGLMYSGTPRDAVQEFDKDAQLDKKINHSTAQRITPKHYAPKEVIRNKITSLKEEKESQKPLFHRERHAHKIRVLDTLDKAYRSGDLDTVRDLVEAKADKRSPNKLLDKDFDTREELEGKARGPRALSQNIWAPNNARTPALIDEVYEDMTKQYVEKQPNRAGLDSKGQDYLHASECPDAHDEYSNASHLNVGL